MEGMRDLLRSSLGRSLRTLTPLDRLAAAWPVVCGAVLASRGELLAFEDGRLTVRVDDPAWREGMRVSRERLTRDLARVAAVELREIHFEGGPERQRRPSAPRDGRATAGQARPASSHPRKPRSIATPNPAKSPRGFA